MIFCRTERTRRHASNSSEHITEAPQETERSEESSGCARLQYPAHPSQTRTRAALAANPAQGRGHQPRGLLKSGEAPPRQLRLGHVPRKRPGASPGFSQKKQEWQLMQSFGNLRTLTILLWNRIQQKNTQRNSSKEQVRARRWRSPYTGALPTKTVKAM